MPDETLGYLRIIRDGEDCAISACNEHYIYDGRLCRTGYYSPQSNMYYARDCVDVTQRDSPANYDTTIQPVRLEPTPEA